MTTVPDCREINYAVSLANIKDQVGALLYAAGVVNDNEDIVDIEFDFTGNTDIVIPIVIKLKKHQQVEVFTY